MLPTRIWIIDIDPFFYFPYESLHLGQWDGDPPHMFPPTYIYYYILDRRAQRLFFFLQPLPNLLSYAIDGNSPRTRNKDLDCCTLSLSTVKNLSSESTTYKKTQSRDPAFSKLKELIPIYAAGGGSYHLPIPFHQLKYISRVFFYFESTKKKRDMI